MKEEKKKHKEWNKERETRKMVEGENRRRKKK
jgi:hypothetical protein